MAQVPFIGIALSVQKTTIHVSSSSNGTRSKRRLDSHAMPDLDGPIESQVVQVPTGSQLQESWAFARFRTETKRRGPRACSRVLFGFLRAQGIHRQR